MQVRFGQGLDFARFSTSVKNLIYRRLAPTIVLSLDFLSSFNSSPGPRPNNISSLHQINQGFFTQKKLRSQQKSQEPRNHHILWNHQAHQHCPRVQLATHQRVLLAQQGTQKIPMYQDLPCQHGLLVVEWWKISGDGPQTCLWCGMG